MEGPSLNQHEIIKFLTLKGGRCTNFELVSNFRGALNHPQHQAEARLKFKDIVNTVAIVAEYQNVKYIELKKEYSDNNLAAESPSPQPSSLSSDSGGSYTSPLTQSFQPYWRYRLSTSTKVPTLPVRNPDNDAYAKTQSGDAASFHLGRSVSESTLSQSVHEIQPPPRSRGRSASGFNRSVSANPTEMLNSQALHGKSGFTGEQPLSRRSSINGYPPQQMSMDFNNPLQNSGLYPQQQYRGQPQSMPSDSRRNSEVFTPERPPRSQWPPSSGKPVSEFPALSHSRSFSGSHCNSPPHQNQYKASNNLDRWKDDRQVSLKRTERSPKRAGICSDDMLRELEEDTPAQYAASAPSNNETTILNAEKQSQRTTENNYSSLPDYSRSQTNKHHHQLSDSQESKPSGTNRPDSKSELGNLPRQAVNRNLFPNLNPQPASLRTNLSNNSLSYDSSSDYDSVSLASSSYDRELSCNSLPNDVFGSQENTGNGSQSDKGIVSLEGGPPPVPPERRRRHSKSTADIAPENDAKQVKAPQQELTNSTGKVKDRVQHFDDLEKRRHHHHPSKRGPSPLPDKENRGSKTSLMEDDVSISVLDPKLKREWCVKAAQGDYYALVGLLKKEPKLAAIKDIASGTALHWGAKHGDANIIKLIAGTYRVNPNIRSGYTAIHIATLYKHTMIVDLLVHTYGADASIRDYSGKRADQYPENYVRTVAGMKTANERRPLKVRPLEKESSVSAFMRIGSLNLRKTRKSTVFASVRGRNWGSASELRLNNYKSTRKKNNKHFQPEKKCDIDPKNDSDSDSAYGFTSK